MNILTFDTEEWYIEKTYGSNDANHYQTVDYYQNAILDLLDEQKLKGTFFCVGGLAREFPEVVRQIAERGHEVGCHSDVHTWLNKMTPEECLADTRKAVDSLEQVIGQKVKSFRAPAFSIGESNKWAFEILSECGIERDASIYPAVRDFGGFAGFPADKPCIVKVGDATLKEFPVSLTTLAGRQMAYSGGGYFRFFPLSFIKKTMKESNYVMTYFHISDLEHHPYKMMSREAYESYFKQPGTFKNRFTRMMKRCIGSSGAFDKMCNLVRAFDYVNLERADKAIDWRNEKTIEL